MPTRVHMDRRMHSMDQGMEKGEKEKMLVIYGGNIDRGQRVMIKRGVSREKYPWRLVFGDFRANQHGLLTAH